MKNIGKVVIGLVLIGVIGVPSVYYLGNEGYLEGEEGVVIGVMGETSIPVGSMFYLNISMDTGDMDIAGVQFSVRYDPSLVTFMMVLPGPFFPSEMRYVRYGDIDGVNGVLDGVAFVCLNGSVNGTGVVAHLVFVGDIGGCAVFGLEDVMVGDREGNEVGYRVTGDSEVMIV